MTLTAFQTYLLAIIAMDGDYEPLETISPFVWSRYGSECEESKLLQTISDLERKGLIRAYKYRPAVDRFRLVRMKAYPGQPHLWFKATREGRARASAVKV